MSHEPLHPGGRDAWIETVDEADAEGELAETYAMVAGRSGTVANILKVHSLHPSALRHHDALYRSVMFERGSLSRAEREAVAVVVSAINGCRY